MLQQIIHEFLNHLRLQYAEESIHSFKWDLKVFASFCEEHLLCMDTIRQSHIERFLLDSSSRQLRKRRLLLLQKFFMFYRQRNMKKHLSNPTANIQIKGGGKERTIVQGVPVLSRINELENNIQAVKAFTRMRNALILELAYGSGLRRGELVGLNVEDIDFFTCCVYVVGKGRKVRYVPLTAVSMRLLRKYVTFLSVQRGPLFVSANTGLRLTRAGMSSLFRYSIGIRPHLLRHACAAHMLENGCSIRLIQELLGHKNITTTQQYTAVSKQKLAAVINAKHPRNIYLAETSGKKSDSSSGTGQQK